MSDNPAPPYPGAPTGPPEGPAGWDSVPAPSTPTVNGWAAPGQSAPAAGPAAPPPGYAPAPGYQQPAPPYGQAAPPYGQAAPPYGQAAQPAYGMQPPVGANPPAGPWQPPGPLGANGAYGQPGAVPLEQIANVVAKPSRKGRVAAAGIGALALVGGGLFAVTQLGASDSGAATPEAAVQELINSFNNEDMLGVMNALPAGERDAFLPVAEQSLAELKRMGVLSDGAELGAIAGLDIEYTDYRMVVNSLGETVANVEVSGGRIRGGYDLAQLPMGRLLIDNMFDGEAPSEARSMTEAVEDPITLTTVKDGSGWHVSLWYTVAEAARDEADRPVPAFGQGVEAIGAASPEAAVEEMVAAMGDLDLRRMIELTPGDEAAALHDYAPLFLNDVEDAVEDFKDEYEIDIAMQATGVVATGEGKSRLVTFDGLEIDGSAAGTDFELSYQDGCYSYDIDGEQDEVCATDQADELDLPESYRQFLDNLASEPSGIRVVERDGAWFVSPIGTVGDSMLRVMRALDEQLIEDLIDDAGNLEDVFYQSSSLFNGGFSLGSVDLNDGDTYYDDDFDDNTFDDFDDDTFDDFDDDAVDAYYEQCGDLDFAVFGAESNAEFQASIQAAHACALPFLQSGQLGEFDITSEVARPECYTAWPWDPNLTLAQQSDLYTQIYACLDKPASF